MDIDLHEERENRENYTCRISDPYDRDVTMTLPTGQRVTFSSSFNKFQPSGDYKTYYTLKYSVPEKAGVAKFEPVGFHQIIAAASVPSYLYWSVSKPSNSEYYRYQDDNLSSHDVTGYTLTMEDGTIYHIDRQPYESQKLEAPALGLDGWFADGNVPIFWFTPYGKPYLSSIDLPTGEMIVFELDASCDKENPTIKAVWQFPADIKTRDIDLSGTVDAADMAIVKNTPSDSRCSAYATGSIDVIHDSEGRIEKIYGPAEKGTAKPTVKYSYDSNGNLEKVYRLVDPTAIDEEDQYEITTYEYENKTYQPWDHYVTAIRDERGLAPIRYEYDGQGRLIATIDAKGNRIAIKHDILGRQEIVTNRAGYPTIYEYNERGNVRYVTDAQGNLTEYAYGDPDNPDKPTQITQQVPDNAHPGQTIPAKTFYYYDNYPGGKIECQTVIDPVENLTKTHYDINGNVLYAIQGKNATSSDVYNEVLTSRTYYTGENETGGIQANLPYLTGTTTGTGTLQWHSISLTYYDPSNRVTCSVQVNMDYITGIDDLYTSANPSEWTYSYLKVPSALPNPTQHSVTSYVYFANPTDPGYSPDQPFSITGPDGQTQYFAYDQNNRQTQSWKDWIDPDDSNHMIRIKSHNILDAQGRTIGSQCQEMDYTRPDAGSAWDLTDDVTTPLSKTEYDSIGKIFYTIDQQNNLTRYDYDQTGNTVRTTTYNITGITWTEKTEIEAYISDSANILTESRTLYDADGRTLVSVGPYAPGDKPDGSETVYDNLGRVSETRRWANVAISLVNLYGSNGDIVGLRLPATVKAGNAWTAAPNGTALAWTSDGKIPMVTESALLAGQVGPLSYSRTEYDSAGRVWKIYSQNEAGTEVFTTEYEYDLAGRQIAVISQPGTDDEIVTETHYDGSRRDYVVDGRQNTTSFIFDAVGRLITTTLPNVGYVYWDASSVLQNTSTAVYQHVGYNGMRQKTRDSAVTAQSDSGHTDNLSDLMHLRLRPKTFGYDTAGRMDGVVLPQLSGGENPDYKYIHDVYGNQVGILDSQLRLTVFGYDHLNRQRVKYMPFEVATTPTSAAEVYAALSAANPAPAAETLDYDTFGRLERHTNYKKQDTGYVYNALGQLWQQKFYAFADTNPADGQNDNYPDNPSQVVEYAYDNLGRQTAVYKDAVLVEAFQYDAEGSVVRIESPEGIVNYDYSPITGRKVRTWTGDTFQTAVSVTEYAYDNLGRLARITVVKRDGQTLGTPEVTQYRYDENGNRHAVTLANGIYTEYTYDALNRLTNLTHYEDDTRADEISHFGYQLYADGMRATVDESMSEQRNVTYRYDALNRLIREDSYTASSPHYGYTANYTYDLAGNRQSRTVTVINSSGQQDLGTSYEYYTGTDRLWKETSTGPELAFQWGGRSVYAYANPNGGRSYQLSDMTGRIGSFTAFALGLPTEWNRWILIALMVLLPVVYFAPVFVQQWRRLKGSVDRQGPPSLKLWQRCLCLLFSYIFLIGPECFQMLALADTQYSQISTASWGSGNRTIEYQYDANGSLINKTTKKTTPNETLETVVYMYNLQNRMSSATITKYVDLDQDTSKDDATVEISLYGYNPDGIRITAELTKNQVLNIGTPQAQTTTLEHKRTDYLVDPANHTGYAQVLQETEYDITNPASPVPLNRTDYVLGDDVISQSKATWATSDWSFGQTQYLLYDGHWSTRQLIKSDLTIQDSYSYDGYGVMLGSAPAPANNAQTSMLYCGEQYDKALSQYYLRARYYNPQNGLFTQMDPYSGNLHDPQSLHKYLYVHNNPINNLDPTGLMIGTLIDMAAAMHLRAMLFWMSYGAAIMKSVYVATLVCGAVYAASSFAILLNDWGYLPASTRDYAEAVQFYSGVGFLLGLSAFAMLSTLPDPKSVARPPKIIPRLHRDVSVDGTEAPAPLPTTRPCATTNTFINAEKDRDVQRLRTQGAFEVRVDQRQVKIGGNGIVQKGLNRPDTQGIFTNRDPIHIEYDTRLDQLIIRRDRILANDPDANVILKWFDSNGNYTIVP